MPMFHTYVFVLIVHIIRLETPETLGSMHDEVSASDSGYVRGMGG